MYRFIEKPHLPKGKVHLVLIGMAYQDALCLERYGITALAIEKIGCTGTSCRIAH